MKKNKINTIKNDTANFNTNIKKNVLKELFVSYITKINEGLWLIIFAFTPLFVWPNFGISEAKNAFFGILLFFLVLLWLIKIILEGKIRLKLNIFLYSLLLFFAYAVISTITSLYPDLSFWGLYEYKGIKDYLLYFLFFIVLITSITQIKQIYRIFYALIFSSFIISILGILSFYKIEFIPFSSKFIFGPNYKAIENIKNYLTFENNGYFSLWLTMVYPVIIYMIIKSKKIIKSIFLLIFIINSYCILLNSSIEIIYVFLISFFVFSFIFSKIFRKKWLFYIFIIITSLLLIYNVIYFVNIKTFNKMPFSNNINNAIEKSELKNNYEIWKMAINPIKDHLILGSGLNSLGPLSFQKGYFSVELAKIKPDYINNKIYSTNNFFVDSMISFGIIGVLFIIYIFGYMFFLLQKMSKNADQTKKIDLLLLSCGLFITLLSGIISSWGIVFWIVIIVYLTFFYFSIIRKNEDVIFPIKQEDKIPIILIFKYVLCLFLILIIGYCAVYIPWKAEYNYQISKTINQNDNPSKILTLQQKAWNAQPRNDDYIRTLTTSKIKVGKKAIVDTSVDDLQKAIKKMPEENIFPILLSLVYFNYASLDESMTEKAYQTVNDSLDSFGNKIIFYDTYIYFYSKLNKVDLLNEKINEALNYNEYFKNYYYLWAAVGYMESNNFIKAIEYLNMMQDDFSPEISYKKYEYLANIYKSKFDYVKASENWEKCIELNSKNETCLENLIYLYINNRDFDKAVKYLQLFEKINKKTAESFRVQLYKVQQLHQ